MDEQPEVLTNDVKAEIVESAKKHLSETLDAQVSKGYFSISELRAYLTCPLYGYFRYGKKLWTESTGAAALVGSSVHFGLARWYSTKKSSRDQALEYTRRYFAEESSKVNWENEKIRDPLGEAVKSEAMLIAALDEGDDWEAEAVERAMYGEIKHSKLGSLPVKLKGVPDLYTKSNIVIDHKTSYRAWDKGKEHKDMQATAYAGLIRDNFGKNPEVLFNIITLNSKGPNVDRRSTYRSQENFDQLYMMARGILDMIEKKAFFPNPEAWFHETCEFRGLCVDTNGQNGNAIPTTRKELLRLVPKLADKSGPKS
jgi:CRISPR/Cas system-associated exonuclease Cas4 (RecB family)